MNLKPVEITILKLIAKDLSSKEIAIKTGFTVRSVDSMKLAMYKKIKVNSVVGALMYSIRHGIVKVKVLDKTKSRK